MPPKTRSQGAKSVSFADDGRAPRKAQQPGEADDVDDFDPASETLLQRVYALKDMVPVHQRRRVADAFGTVSSYARSAAGVAGIIAWVLSTSALLVVLPLGIELEREQFLIMQENEQRLQQQAAQQMLQPNMMAPLLAPGLQQAK
eukprot:Unigene8263_Nuclearia_a/m.25379 Unigene8263_Nuclearia_a/g.25379  ORF Unigene8263_Nuclearia_a/g.25379 Unigene8263_Nuclearia_a/m.25379 type:complete len:145 (-) Unigene8263_Nuclearia_a:89-523(-)